MSMDKLIEKIAEKQNPTVAGLDPKLSYIPEHIRSASYEKYGKTLEGAADAGWIALAAVAGTAVNIAALFAGRHIEKKYGAKLDEKLLQIENKLLAYRERVREKIKARDEEKKRKKQEDNDVNKSN